MRWTFRVLAAAAIVFAAGISGTWLGEQMRSPLPIAWGWFGAVVLAAAVFGGVYLAARGDRVGFWIVVMGALGEITLDWHFFAYARHDLWTAAVLASFPTLTAILAGAVEARFARAERDAEQAERSDAVAWERQRELRAMELAHRRELARIRAESAVQANGNGRTRPDDVRKNGHLAGRVLERPERLALLRENADTWTAAAVAERFGISVRQARRDLTDAGFVRVGRKWTLQTEGNDEQV